jgi:hypothetical protein
MKNKIILAVTSFIVLVVAVIGVLVFGTGRLWSKGTVSLSIDKPPLKLTLKRVSITTIFNEPVKTQEEYQVDVWSFLERTDGKMINTEDNVTLGGIQLFDNKGKRIPHTDTIFQTSYESNNVPMEYRLGKKMDFSQNARVLRHSLFVKAEHIHKLSNATITIFLGLTNKDKNAEPLQFDGIHLPVS